MAKGKGFTLMKRYIGMLYNKLNSRKTHLHVFGGVLQYAIYDIIEYSN